MLRTKYQNTVYIPGNIFQGKKINAGSLEEFIKEISKLFPAEKDSISAFFSEAEKAYRECYSETGEFRIPLPAELIVKVHGEKSLSDYPKKHPHFFGWMNTTYKKKLDEYGCIGLSDNNSQPG